MAALKLLHLRWAISVRYQEAIARREAGESLVEIARSYYVSHPIISRLRGLPQL
ncbi:MAG TPA: hypothetical protein VKE53_04215 [Pseudolabrys sp.]|nr:hypothetical protein [Pseudolabrys sp.]